MAEKDIAEKSLEALNDVFADIINGFLFHGEQIINDNLLVDAQPYSVNETRRHIHGQERDIAKYWIRSDDKRIHGRLALIGIENQTSYDPRMILRVMDYDLASYKEGYDQRLRYPAVTLVLYFGFSPWGKNRSLSDMLDIPEQLVPFFSNYKLNLFEVSFLTEEQAACFRGDFRAVADYFIHARTDPDYRPKEPVRFQHAKELLRLMAVLTHDERYRELAEDEEGGIPENMCEVLDRAEARGEARGRAIGRFDGMLLTLAGLVRDGILSLSDAAGRAGLSPKEFEEKTAMLMRP